MKNQKAVSAATTVHDYQERRSADAAPTAKQSAQSFRIAWREERGITQIRNALPGRKNFV
jgi:hypothetical protein